MEARVFDHLFSVKKSPISADTTRLKKHMRRIAKPHRSGMVNLLDMRNEREGG